MKKIFFGILAIACLICAFAEYVYHAAHKTIKKESATNIIISEGDDIAKKLTEAGITNNAFITRCILFYMKEFRNVHYHFGEYRIPNNYTLLTVINKFNRHDVIVHNIKIYRGTEIREIKERINARRDLLGEITVPLKEGDLVAGTYEFVCPTTKDELITRMIKYANQEIETIWNQRTKNCTVTSIQDLKIFASIIAKEANYHTKEIQLVAGVFNNRIKKGMPLQADSTLVYYRRISNNSDNITYREFMACKHPYNTYKVKGLPPAPISTPSHQELLAVAVPIETDYLYFQHDTRNGDVFFSKDFARHLKIQKIIANIKEENKYLKEIRDNVD